MKPKLPVLLSIVILCNSCLYSYKCKFLGSSPISNSLFLERYKTFDAGVWGENIDCYITDSISFRKKIGSYDEHEFLFAKQEGNSIEAYNVASSYIPDTLETKRISKSELYTNHYSDSSCLNAVPVFGKNTIRCDSDYYDASSYKIDGGYYMSQVQYKCGNDYLNAVYYTDSSKFRFFIGVYSPGSFSNNYSIKLNADNTFDFYNVEEKPKVDTVKHVTYLLSDLKKGSLINVCK
ncbi:MAG: hypothetical protein ABIN97_12005 [Ginsengibacter sp.]